MIRASSSGASNSSNRIPFTVPAVPTGIKTGVSITPRRVVSKPERASPSRASTSKLNGFVFIRNLTAEDAESVAEERRGFSQRPLRSPQPSRRLISSFSLRFMSFDDPDRRRKEIKLFAQAILQMAQKRKVQTSFASGSENHKRRRTHSNLCDVLHVQTRSFVRFRRSDA